MGADAAAVMEELRNRFGLPVFEHDERFSSKRAGREFASLRAAGLKRKKDAELLDAMAAAVILEDYLAAHGG
jgi:putative holliday junction resolvase